MHAKRLLSLLMTAMLTVAILAGCFRRSNDFSREAVKAVNKTQNSVDFSTDSRLTKSLLDAVKENVQTNDVKSAMMADADLNDLLTSVSQLDIYAIPSDDAKNAAQTDEGQPEASCVDSIELALSQFGLFGLCR